MRHETIEIRPTIGGFTSPTATDHIEVSMTKGIRGQMYPTMLVSFLGPPIFYFTTSDNTEIYEI